MKTTFALLALAALAALACAGPDATFGDDMETEEPVHPTCTAAAEKKCHDSCRERNYDMLDDFVDVLFGGEGPDRRRRGTVPTDVVDMLEDYLRGVGATCYQTRLRKRRDGACVCKCKQKRVNIDCSLIENGGFQDGSNWKINQRGDTISEVTDDMFFSHYPSPLPLGVNGNYQGIAAGIDNFCGSDHYGRRRRGSDGPGSTCAHCSGNITGYTCGTAPGQIVLRQHFKVPKESDHVVLVYGMATDTDNFSPHVGPNAQGYRVDIMHEKAPFFSAAAKHVAMPLIAQGGFSEPNIYAHDLTKAVAEGGKFVLRYSASALFKPQTLQVDHVHMCAIKCGANWEQGEPKEEEETTPLP